MRLLAGAGVLVGFFGGGATPLFSGVEIQWFSPQNEYRPTEYVQGWLSFGLMIKTAHDCQSVSKQRLEFTQKFG